MRFDFFLFLFFRFNLILRELMFAITGQFVTSQVGWIIKIARAFRTFIIYSLMFLFVTPQRRMGTESRFRTVCVCLDEFYFTWLEKDIIGIVKVVSIPLILNHLKWKPFDGFEFFTNLKVFLHVEQGNIFSCVWIFICRTRFALQVNSFQQKSQ